MLQSNGAGYADLILTNNGFLRLDTTTRGDIQGHLQVYGLWSTNNIVLGGQQEAGMYVSSDANDALQLFAPGGTYIASTEPGSGEIATGTIHANFAGNGANLTNIPGTAITSPGSATNIIQGPFYNYVTFTSSTATHYVPIAPVALFNSIETNANFAGCYSNVVSVYSLEGITNVGLQLGTNGSITVRTNGGGTGPMANSAIVANFGATGFTNYYSTTPFNFTNCAIDYAITVAGTTYAVGFGLRLQ
jgi:hypothetical protein